MDYDTRPGEWFFAREKAQELELNEADVRNTLDLMVDGEVGYFVMERKKSQDQYKIIKKGKRRVEIPLSSYDTLVTELESLVQRVESVVIGKRWEVNTSPKLIQSQLEYLSKRLKEAKKFIRDKSR